MGLLDGGMAAILDAAFSGIYLDATLHRPTLTDDGAGGGSSSFVDEPVKAQLDSTTQEMQQAIDFTDTDQRILVLAHGVDPFTTDAEITVRDIRWSIASVSQDPAAAYYELRGRKSGNA